jgi:hypothetical protein
LKRLGLVPADARRVGPDDVVLELIDDPALDLRSRRIHQRAGRVLSSENERRVRAIHDAAGAISGHAMDLLAQVGRDDDDAVLDVDDSEAIEIDDTTARAAFREATASLVTDTRSALAKAVRQQVDAAIARARGRCLD